MKGIHIQEHTNDKGLKLVHVMAFPQQIGTEEEAISEFEDTIERLKNEALPEVYHLYREPSNKFNVLLVTGL